MKSILPGLVLICCSGISTETAFSREAAPLLVKETSSGFVPRALVRSERCAIYRDKTVISRSFGGQQIKSKETRNQQLSGAVEELLQKASQAAIESTSGPVDGPTIKYYGNLPRSGQSTIRVTLGEENGGNGTILRNPSEAAQTLRNTISVLCPHTLSGISDW
jgi:hypothetical protein